MSLKSFYSVFLSPACQHFWSKAFIMWFQNRCLLKIIKRERSQTIFTATRILRQICIIPSETFDKSDPLMWRMWEEHIYCVQNDQKWLPVSPAHCQYSYWHLLLCFTFWGLRNIPLPFRWRLCEYLRHKWIVTWSNSCLRRRMSCKHRSLETIHFWNVDLAIHMHVQHGRKQRKGGHLRLLYELNKWEPALTGHLACRAPATERAFSLFKILPLIWRKITHSWVTKSHLCSVASRSHLIPIYLIWTVLLFQNLMQI